jgi:hypothetical protein
MYHINDRRNEMSITELDIPWVVREKALRIHYLHGLPPHSKPDDDTIKEASQTMGIKIICKEQLHRNDHQVLARAFILRVQYSKPATAPPSDEFDRMRYDFQKCGVFCRTDR